MKRLEGKTALVSGASRGIGKAIAKRLGDEGATVVLVSRKQEALDAVAAELADANGATYLPRACHAGYTEQITALFDGLEADGHTPTILVNNAATNPYFGPMMGIDEGAFQKTFDVNLRGYFEMTRGFASRLLKNKTAGSVVNIASIMGIQGAALQGVYGMSKAAIVHMTKTFAIELGQQGIRVNCIAPGLVDTKFASVLINTPDIVKMFTDRTALKRYAQPEEISGAVAFLASDDASYVTGQTLAVDGGYTIM